MYAKLVVVACFVAVSSAAWNGPLAGGEPAAKYPAGISPQACPNYPNCENPAVAVNPSAPAHGYAAPAAPAWNNWNPAPANNYAAQNQWNAPQQQWNNAPHDGQWNQNALDSGEYTGDGDYRGEGLAESGAEASSYNGYAGVQGPAAQGYAGSHNQAPVVPAGVDPQSCPNYPYCH